MATPESPGHPYVARIPIFGRTVDKGNVQTLLGLGALFW